MKRRCFDTLHGDRCELEPHTDGLHRRGAHTWGFREGGTIPEWRRRADVAYREHGMVATKELR